MNSEIRAKLIDYFSEYLSNLSFKRALEIDDTLSDWYDKGIISADHFYEIAEDCVENLQNSKMD